ncbi:MAG: InlB B-repeat-containing protein [Eubacterium sp.]|nr:InlB B-repeat-containing protein [Eubacterium sp.]
MIKKLVTIIMTLSLVLTMVPNERKVSAYSEPIITNANITYPISLATGKDAKGKLVFPDNVFLQYIAHEEFKSGKYQSYPFDLNQDGMLSEAECDQVRYLAPEINKNVASVKGIEAFPKLRELYCGSTNIKELDVSNNPKLQKLYCPFNELRTLDVSNCPELKELDFSGCGILAVDLRHNKELSKLECYWQKINAYEFEEGNKYFCKLQDFDLRIILDKISNLKIDGAYGDNINSGYDESVGIVFCSDKMQKITYNYKIDVSSTKVTDVDSFDVTLNIKDGKREEYDSQGGNEILPQFIESGNTDIEPEAPVRNGYEFLGWYTTPECMEQSKWVFENEILSNFTLYAKWKKKNYQVNYNSAGGSPKPAAKNVDWWTKNILPNTQVSKLGYTLSGWKSSAGIVVNASNNSKLSYGDIFRNSEPTRVTLTAVWKAKSGYQLKYDSNLSSKQKKRLKNAPKYSASKRVIWNQTKFIPKFSQGYILGYTFVGWYTAKHGGEQITDTFSYDKLYQSQFRGDSTSNIPIAYARYQKSKDTIVYNTRGGTKLLARKDVLYGTKNILPKEKTKKKGYKLIGWKCDGKRVTKKTRLKGMMAEEAYVELTAIWKKKGKSSKKKHS